MKEAREKGKRWEGNVSRDGSRIICHFTWDQLKLFHLRLGDITFAKIFFQVVFFSFGNAIQRHLLGCAFFAYRKLNLGKG